MRSLLMRRVATTPSSDQSNTIAPPSWAAILRCTNLLPKPSSVAGTLIGGPPRSVQVITTSSPWALHDTSNVPLATDSDPYFAELERGETCFGARRGATVSIAHQCRPIGLHHL